MFNPKVLSVFLLLALVSCNNSVNDTLSYVEPENKELEKTGTLLFTKEKTTSDFDTKINIYNVGTYGKKEVERINFKITINQDFKKYNMDYIAIFNDDLYTPYYFDGIENYGSITYINKRDNTEIEKCGVRLLNKDENFVFGFYIKNEIDDKEVINVIDFNYYCIKKHDYNLAAISYYHNDSNKKELHEEKNSFLNYESLNWKTLSVIYGCEY